MARALRKALRLVGVWIFAAALEACGGQDATSLGTEVQLVMPAEPAGSPAAPAGQIVESDHVKTLRQADGSYASEVNATDMQRWVYFSLRGSGEVTPEDPQQSDGWDLGFQRSNVKLNGGASGPGGVTVAIADGSFESVVAAPVDGYVADTEDADLDGNPDYALGAGDGWYEYDPASHKLTARSTVFVLQTPGGHFKLQFSSYYDAAGTPGVPQFRWAPLGP